jgi:hypothetical protein
MVSGAETPQGKPRTHYSATALRPRQQVGSVNVVHGPTLKSSTQRIISRIKTKDLINQHKLPPVTPSIAPSVEGPALWKSPISELVTSQPTPTTPDLNRIDGGIEIWDDSFYDRHGPTLKSSTQRIISRIKTKDLINQHKPPPVTPSIASSVGGPALWKSPYPSRSHHNRLPPRPTRAVLTVV